MYVVYMIPINFSPTLTESALSPSILVTIETVNSNKKGHLEILTHQAFKRPKIGRGVDDADNYFHDKKRG